MDEMIEKINNILRYQMKFRWQNIYNYKCFKNSFEYHVQHHPKDERKTGKWNSLIDYSTHKTISDSYYEQRGLPFVHFHFLSVKRLHNSQMMI